MLQDGKNELLQNILLLKVSKTTALKIWEFSNKNGLKRDSFKYYILGAVVVLGTDSLLYQTCGAYVSYIYINIYIRCILYIWSLRYMIYIYIWYGIDDIGIQNIWYTYMVYLW